jgi:hypothetical protein
MSSNGPPPSELERIKTKLTNAGLSLKQVDMVIKSAQESAHVLGVALEQIADGMAKVIARTDFHVKYPTSPPPIKKHHHNRNKLPKFTDSLEFITRLVDETP